MSCSVVRLRRVAFAGDTRNLMIEEMIAGYEQALSDPAGKRKPSGKATEPIQFVLKQALKRRWRHLAEERIENVKPSIPLGERFWLLSQAEKGEINRLFASEQPRCLISCLRNRDAKDPVEVLDAAYWMKGSSSLGRLRFAVLVGVGTHKHRTICLIDIKEAIRAAAPHATNSGMPRNNADRVVAGVRSLSPYLGKRMLAAELMGKSVVLRELLPQDLKLEMDRLTRDEIVASGRFLASVVGRAHARQIDENGRKSWMSDLQRNRSKKLDAPSWLWTSVVELVASHERGYLEHCREFALASAR